MTMSFGHTHALWSDRALELVRPVGKDWRTKFEQGRFDHIQKFLDEAMTTYADGEIENAWSTLLSAVAAISHFRGKMDANARAAPAAQIAVLNGARGAKGGENKGVKFENLRQKVADALVESYKQKPWKKKVEYEIAYQLVISNLNISLSEYNRNKLHKIERIKEILPKGY